MFKYPDVLISATNPTITSLNDGHSPHWQHWQWHWTPWEKKIKIRNAKMLFSPPHSSLILCDCHNSYLQMIQFKMMFGSNILAIFLLSPFIKAYCCVVTFSSLLSLLSMPFNAFCTLCSFGKWQLKENMKFKDIVQINNFFTCNKRQHQRRQSLSLWLKPAPKKLLQKNMKPNK